MSTEAPRIRILTVDDHPMLRDGIAAVIETQPDMVLVAEATDGYEAVEKFRQYRPDVTLMDIQMPGMTGVEAISQICKEFPSAVILVLTTYKGDVQAVNALRAGARGFLLKSVLRKEMVDTIRKLHAGKRCIVPEIAAQIADHAIDDELTMRETQVLKQVASGNSNKNVANTLGISEETVKAHMKGILSKLGAKDRTHAVMIAVSRGIIQG
jgi:DNA-binding NarL/FixJ family response regulator